MKFINKNLFILILATLILLPIVAYTDHTPPPPTIDFINLSYNSNSIFIKNNKVYWQPRHSSISKKKIFLEKVKTYNDYEVSIEYLSTNTITLSPYKPSITNFISNKSYVITGMIKKRNVDLLVDYKGKFTIKVHITRAMANDYGYGYGGQLNKMYLIDDKFLVLEMHYDNGYDYDPICKIINLENKKETEIVAHGLNFLRHKNFYIIKTIHSYWYYDGKTTYGVSLFNTKQGHLLSLFSDSSVLKNLVGSIFDMEIINNKLFVATKRGVSVINLNTLSGYYHKSTRWVKFKKNVSAYKRLHNDSRQAIFTRKEKPIYTFAVGDEAYGFIMLNGVLEVEMPVGYPALIVPMNYRSFYGGSSRYGGQIYNLKDYSLESWIYQQHTSTNKIIPNTKLKQTILMPYHKYKINYQGTNHLRNRYRSYYGRRHIDFIKNFERNNSKLINKHKISGLYFHPYTDFVGMGYSLVITNKTGVIYSHNNGAYNYPAFFPVIEKNKKQISVLVNRAVVPISDDNLSYIYKKKDFGFLYNYQYKAYCKANKANIITIQKYVLRGYPNKDKGKVISNYVAMKKHKIVTKIYQHNKVYILREYGKWCKVYVPKKNVMGYVNKKYLKKTK